MQKDFIASFGKLVRIYGSMISATISALLAGFYMHNVYNGIIVWLVIFFTITFGFAINDYYDYQKDNLYPHKHVIAAGLLSRNQVGVISMVLFLLSALITFLLTPFQQVINGILLFILLIYSFINNRNGLLANVLVAVCSSLSILIAQQGIRYTILLFSSISVFFFIFGREIIKDIHDIKADGAIGKSSIPITYSKELSFKVAMLLTLLSLSFSVFTGIYFTSWIFLITMVAAHCLYMHYVLQYQKHADEKHYQNFSKYSKISFLMIVPALLIAL